MSTGNVPRAHYQRLAVTGVRGTRTPLNPLKKSVLQTTFTLTLAQQPHFPSPSTPPAHQHRNPQLQNAVVTSPVTMWLDAIDMALSRLADLSSPPQNASSETLALESLPETERSGWGRWVLSRVRAVSASGQQHGTVFWKAGAREKLEGLGKLGPRETLVEVRVAAVFCCVVW